MSSRPYSPIYRSGDWAAISGQLGLLDGELPESFGDQARQLFRNLAEVLSSNGLGAEQVAKATVFLSDIDDYTEMNEIYVEFFGSHRPARSAIAVAALPLGASIEVEAWVFTG